MSKADIIVALDVPNVVEMEAKLQEMPDLELKDILASLKYVSKIIDHPIIAA